MFFSRKTPSARRRAGFTRLECALTLALVGVLSVLAAPGFKRLNSGRADARSVLTRIAEMQANFYRRHERYAASFGQLGLDLHGGRIQADGSLHARRYTYTLETGPRDGRDHARFRVTATADVDPSDPILDILFLDDAAPAGAEPVILSDDLTDDLRETAS